MSLNTHSTPLAVESNSVYNSPDALEAYLADVARRRELRRAEREKRCYWETAVKRLDSEIHAAQQDEDFEIAAELSVVRAGFARLLAGLTQAHSEPKTELADALLSLPAPIDEPPISYETAVVLSPVLESEPVPAPVPLPASEPTVIPQLHLSPEENESLIAGLQAELDALQQRFYVLREAAGRSDGSNAYERLFRLRGLACEVNRIGADARKNKIEAALYAPIRQIRDSLEIKRELLEDRGGCLPFDEPDWSSPDVDSAVAHWDTLARHYERMAEAQTDWDWLCDHKEVLAVEIHLDILNDIAAVQQSLHRTLLRMDGRDRLQTDSFIALKEQAYSVGYLSALKPGMSDAELESLAQNLRTAADTAKKTLTEQAAKQEKAARKEAAITAVESFFAAHPGFGLAPEMVTEDRAGLLPLLDECRSAGVPMSDVRVREAILECAPLLLGGQAHYSQFLKYANEERGRREERRKREEESAMIDEEDLPLADTQIEEFKRVIRPYAEGKRLLLLGGVPRPRLCDELENALGFAEVKWPESKKSDKAAKFRTEINKADALIFVKNYASHEMGDKGKEWIKANSGDFIVLPSGYGVNQIIHQLYEYVSLRNGVH